MKIIFNIRRDDVGNYVKARHMGHLVIDIERDYVMQAARDAIEYNVNVLDGQAWLDYLVETLGVDHFLEVKVMDFDQLVFSEEERQELLKFEESILETRAKRFRQMPLPIVEDIPELTEESYDIFNQQVLEANDE